MYYPNPTSYLKAPLIEDVTPFSPIVLKAHYNKFNWDKIKPFCERVMSKNIKTNTNWSVDKDLIDTKILDEDVPHLNPIFKEFYDWLNPIVMEVIVNKFGYSSFMGYAIYNSWINLHVPNGSTSTHNHGPAVVAVSTYLYMPENGGYIEFFDPLEYHKTPFPRTIDDQISNWKEVPTITGDVCLFPGWLKHRTQPNKSKENRWVLTTNYICTNLAIEKK